MNLGELDSLLERAGQIRLKKLERQNDLLELQRWAKNAEDMLVELRQALRSQVGVQGGMLALRLRQLLEEQIVKELNGRTVLTPETIEHSLAVHIVAECVFVDVRLRIGKVREDGTAQLGGDTPR